MSDGTTPYDVHALRLLLESVEGWLSVPDAAYLAAAAERSARAGGNAPLVVEVGAWKGRSAIALAHPLAKAGRGRVVSIDPHRGYATDPSNTLPDFLRNVERAGLAPVVTAIRSDSLGAVDRFENGSIDVFFLDASHEYEATLRDITAWIPKLAPGATVAFDDADWPGVNRALREIVARPDGPFRHPRYLGKILYVTYEPGTPASAADRVATLRLRAFLHSLLIGRRISERLHWRLQPPGKLLVRLLVNPVVTAVSATRAALALVCGWLAHEHLQALGRTAWDAVF